MIKYRPKLLIVADRAFWAYHFIQKFIVSSLSADFDIYTDFILFYPLSKDTSLKGQLVRYKHYIKAWPYRRILPKKQKYDIIVYLGYYFNIPSRISDNTNALIRGIFTDGFPPQCVDKKDSEISVPQFVSKYLSDADAVVCGAQSIANIYSMCIDNVHVANLSWEGTFKRQSPKLINSTDRFLVGWTGNPNREFKGFYDYVVPAVEAAKKLRPGIELKKRFSGPIETLPDFYSDVDVALIASNADAGPSLFSEAAFSDVPSISTKVGHPGRIIQNGINGLFVDKNVIEMRNAIIRLYDDRNLLFNMSQRIREDTAEICGTEKMKEAWRGLFHSVL